MKKTYLTPTAEVLSVVMESTFICASGENLVGRDYGTGSGEISDGFWE